MVVRLADFKKQIVFAITLACPVVVQGQESALASPKATDKTELAIELPLVQENESISPRFTPVTREVMKQYLEHLKQRTPRIPLPPLTDDEKQKTVENPRASGYESRLRILYLTETAGNGYNGFGGSPNSSNPERGNGASGRTGAPDPNLTLEYAFKVKLFWIAARGNNCQYCLGHQESKLLAAGLDEDEIAALDFDWDVFPESERAAFSLARKLTLDPHLISDQDIDACRRYYSDLQIIEMIGSVSGNNAINRWKEGTGVPQSSGGGNFGRQERREETATNAGHSYLSPTSEKYANRKSIVVSMDSGDVSLKKVSSTQCKRPPLVKGDELIKKLSEVKTRKPRLPLAEEAQTREVMGDTLPSDHVPQWSRLLANFPVAGKRFTIGLMASREASDLSPQLQAELDWVIARQDRAWYATALAHNRLKELATSDEVIESLDSDLQTANENLDSKDRLLLVLAKNLAASPIVLTDRQVQQAIDAAGAKAVTQAINYTTYRAAFNRITEAAGLSTP